MTKLRRPCGEHKNLPPEANALTNILVIVVSNLLLGRDDKFVFQNGRLGKRGTTLIGGQNRNLDSP